MCGILGLVNIKSGKEIAEKISCIQEHRGPDAQQVWQQGNVVLSHQRLSIIDLDPRANQPFIKDNYAIIFNGEIYNYKELKSQILEQDPGIIFTTESDTEVLLELFRLKKEKCLAELVGMFAFAIYDIRQESLFLARDHFGIKPLFYSLQNNSFVFSSELKTIISIPGFDKKLNLKSLVGAVNYLWVPGNETMFKDFFKIPPAHYLKIDTGNEVLQLNMQRYWELDTRIKYTNEQEASAALSDAIQNSIKRHMIADVPVSSFLSGGLDSSLISVLASKINPGLSTYTIATSGQDKMTEQMPEDELYAAELAKRFGFDHHEIRIDPDIVNNLKKMVYTLDEPIGDPAALNTFLICKAAKEKGVKVLLSGMGADEIFFGYRRQKATLKGLSFKKLPTAIRKIISATVHLAPVRMGRKGLKLTRWAKRFLSFAELPFEESYMRSYSYFDPSEISQLFIKNISDEYASLRQEHKNLFNAHYHGDPVNQICFTDIHMFMTGLNLTYTDRASMAASVEVRVPFIDKEVVTKAMQMAGSLKYKKGKSKFILKKLSEAWLPAKIIYRPKASFGAPIRSWISGELVPMVDDLLSKETVENRGIFNYEYIKKLVEDDRKGLADNAYRIYQLMTIELWFRHYMDNDKL